MRALDTAAVAAHVARVRAEWDVPGVAVAVVDGRDGPVLVEGYGVCEVGTSDRVDAGTVFSIASLTKAFTAVAAAAAVDERLLDWDTPLVRHLPYLRLYDPYVTAEASLRDALCHRVCISQHYHNGLALSREEMIRELAKDVPIAPFRAEHSYHNIMYAAGGEAVAASAGETWDDHVRAVILEPLGMTSSSTSAAALAEARNVACSHLRDRAGEVRVDPFRPRGWWSMDNHAPAGAINATAADMATWLQFLLGDGSWRGTRVVSARNLAETLTPQACHRDTYYSPFPALAYGFGWEVTTYAGRLLRWHMGTFRGVVSVAILSPEDGLGVFVAANSRDADYGMAHVALAHWLVDEALGLVSGDHLAPALAERDRLAGERRDAEQRLLERFASGRSARLGAPDLCGDYTHPLDGRYRVRAAHGGLEIERLGCSEPYRADLEHLGGDAYRAHWDETVIEYEPAQVVAFSSDGHGGARSALLHRMGGATPLECRRDG